MASLQDQVAALPERLIDGLQYDNMGEMANYVLDCDMATMFPASGNFFSPTGIRVIRINIASNLWMAPDTARLCCTIRATTNPLVPKGPMSLMFSRVRILAGGVVLADQVEFNRLGRTLHKLMSPQAYIDLCNESFDCSVSTSLPAAGEWIHNPVLAGGEKRIQMPLTQLGLFAQSKILPCRYLTGLSLEFEITPDANEWLNIAGGPPTWELFDVSLKANMLQLDSGLESAIATKMLSGVELPMATREYVTVTQVLTGGTFNLQLTRGLSRLTSIFVTFERAVVGDGTPAGDAAAVVANDTNPPKMNLYYPTAAADLPEWQLQIGSKNGPRTRFARAQSRGIDFARRCARKGVTFTTTACPLTSSAATPSLLR